MVTEAGRAMNAIVKTNAETLPPALRALGARRQFIVCEFSVHPENPAKTVKRPLNPTARMLCDHLDPPNWMNADTAYVQAARLNTATDPSISYGVGFVLPRDPSSPTFWCLDIDDGLGPDRHWRPAVLALLKQLSGVAIECAFSRRCLKCNIASYLLTFECRNSNVRR